MREMGRRPSSQAVTKQLGQCSYASSLFLFVFWHLGSLIIGTSPRGLWSQRFAPPSQASNIFKEMATLIKDLRSSVIQVRFKDAIADASEDLEHAAFSVSDTQLKHVKSSIACALNAKSLEQAVGTIEKFCFGLLQDPDALEIEAGLEIRQVFLLVKPPAVDGDVNDGEIFAQVLKEVEGEEAVAGLLGLFKDFPVHGQPIIKKALEHKAHFDSAIVFATEMRERCKKLIGFGSPMSDFNNSFAYFDESAKFFFEGKAEFQKMVMVSAGGLPDEWANLSISFFKRLCGGFMHLGIKAHRQIVLNGKFDAGLTGNVESFKEVVFRMSVLADKFQDSFGPPSFNARKSNCLRVPWTSTCSLSPGPCKISRRSAHPSGGVLTKVF